MEPGSTFKIVVVSGALNDGVVQLNDTFDCEHGHFAYAGRILHDHEPFGILTTEGIITKSSNIGAAKIGIRLGEDRLYDYAWDYGFGQRTGIPLPGEVARHFASGQGLEQGFHRANSDGPGRGGDAAANGDGDGAIANGGWLMQPMLVSRLKDRDGNVVEQYAPQRVRQVISRATDK